MTKRTNARRKTRARPTPKWLKEQKDLDEIARRRCLMVLSVLSGEHSVSDAIEEAQISRQMYYQLEERALHAMLRALSPGATSEETASAGAVKRAQELEAKVGRLEQEKRRSERLLLLTRKLVGKRMKTAAGRPRRSAKATSAGKLPSVTSKKRTRTSSESPKSASSITKAASTPSTIGEDER